MASKRQHPQSNTDLSFLLSNGRRLIPSVQSLVFDYLDPDTLTAVGVTSRTAQLFLQRYLSQLTALTACDHQNRHRLLFSALLFCRRLTHLNCCYHSRLTEAIVTGLIQKNSSTLQEVSGMPITQPSILCALLDCSNLQSLCVQTLTRESFECAKALVLGCQQITSLRFGAGQTLHVGKMLKKASPDLLELSTPILRRDELELVVSRFTKLQTLHVTLGRIEACLPALRQMASLTDLSITSGAADNSDDIRLFLQSRGYSHPHWDVYDYDEGEEEDGDEDEDMAEPNAAKTEERKSKIQVLELPHLRKLKLDEACTANFSVKSEVLEEATLTVFYPGLALEIIRHSPVMRKVDLFLQDNSYDEVGPTSRDEEVFIESCRRWPHLTHLTSEMGLYGNMVSALVAHCRRLESLNGRLRTCSENSVLALLMMPQLTTLILDTFKYFFSEQQTGAAELLQEEADARKPLLNQNVNSTLSKSTQVADLPTEPETQTIRQETSVESHFELPPVIRSGVHHLCIAGKWYNSFVDRIQFPHLHTLNLQISVVCPELRIDPLLASAVQSLTIMSLCRNKSFGGSHLGLDNPVPLVDSSFDWSRCTKLKSVQAPKEMSAKDLATLARTAPNLNCLSAFLHSADDLAQILDNRHSALRTLCIDSADQPWPHGCLDDLLPTLLDPERRPQRLRILRVPLGSLSQTVLSTLSLAAGCQSHLGGIPINVAAYHPA